MSENVGWTCGKCGAPIASRFSTCGCGYGPEAGLTGLPTHYQKIMDSALRRELKPVPETGRPDAGEAAHAALAGFWHPNREIMMNAGMEMSVRKAIAAAVAAERERCAKIADDVFAIPEDYSATAGAWRFACLQIATKIRSGE